ncbi:unnamed protein product [Symbiodinium sp. CCMP2592]|nr:unnamed protein product [Symbiodinium sp. CCMP2592]
MAQSDYFPENFSELSAWDLWDASERFAGRDGYSREQWFSFWRSALQDQVDASTQDIAPPSTLPASEGPGHEWGTEDWVPTPVLSTDEPPSSLPTPTTEEAEDFNYVPWNFSQLSEVAGEFRYFAPASRWCSWLYLGYPVGSFAFDDLYRLVPSFTIVGYGFLILEIYDAAVSHSFATLDSGLDAFLASKGWSPDADELPVLRMLWVQAHKICNLPSVASDSSASTLHTSWAETFPPKLSSETTLQLKRDFEKSYPSEILDDTNFPSARLLSLAYRLKGTSDWKFISWKHRLSKQQEEDYNSSRPRKLARFENFTDVLYDDVPSRNVAENMGLYGISNLLSIHSNALALADIAHLATLRVRSSRCWEVVGQLRQEGWSVDDALHEFTDVRAELVALLAPRLAPFKGKKGDGKGGKEPWKGLTPKGGKSTGGKGGTTPGKGKSTFTKGTHAFEWANKAKINGETKVLCMAYSTHKGCTSNNCKFEHLCPVILENGEEGLVPVALPADATGIFLDINGGARRPLSAAFLGAGCDTFSVALLHILLCASDFPSNLFDRMIQIAHACFAAGSHVLLSQHSGSSVWSHASVIFLLQQMGADAIFWDPQRFGCNFEGFGLLAASFSSLQFLATASSTGSSMQAHREFDFSSLSADFVLAVAEGSLHLFAQRSPEPKDLQFGQIPFLRHVKARFDPPFANQDGAGIYSVPDWSTPPPGVPDVLCDLRSKLRQWIFDEKIPQRLQAHALQHSSEPLFQEGEIQHLRQLFQSWVSEQGSSHVIDWTIPDHQPYALHALKFFSQFVKVEAFADARADGELIGIGGFIAFPSGAYIWFSQAWQLSDLSVLSLELRRPAHKDIACYETLAQIALVHAYRSVFPSGRVAVRLPSFPDNASTEALGAKLYTAKWPLGAFAQKLSLISAASGIELDISHIAGEKNDDADLLSRWNQTDSLPDKWRKEDRVDCSLKFIWFFRKEVLVWPSHFSLPAVTQERHVSDDDI